MRGYYGIGIYQPKHNVNVGGLWRSAFLMDAAFCFTIAGRYRHQASDTYKTSRHVPLYEYDAFEEFYQNMPKGCKLVAVELTPDAQPIETYEHPQRAIYLLGAEDDGLPPRILERCHEIIQLSGGSFNVATSGSIVMYDRATKQKLKAS